MECKLDTIVIANSTEVKAFKMACRRWTCEECRPVRLYHLKQLAKAGKPVSMITLTASSDEYSNPDEMARALVHGWRMVLQRGKREGLFENPQYLAIFEEHESGFPHLHILWRGPYVPQQWLSDRMQEYCHGPNVWINFIYNQKRTAWYVAKYCSKGPGRFEGCKRYWRSLGWLSQEEKERRKAKKSWSTVFFTNQSVVHQAFCLEMHGWQVEVSDDGFLEARAGPESNWPYYKVKPPPGIEYGTWVKKLPESQWINAGEID